MGKNTSAAGFLLGSVVGAAIGAVAGMMLAPRPGSESRAMAADAMNDAWDTAVDTYEQGSKVVQDKVSEFRTPADPAAATDELRAKVEAARERMEQLRTSLSESVAAASVQVQDVANTVADMVSAVAEAETTEAEDVRVEVVEDEK